jgi:sugar lactone lactonase YvrE
MADWAEVRHGRRGFASPQAHGEWRVEPFVQGAPLYASNGIRFGPDGRLWICQSLGDLVSAWDPRTGEISDVTRPGSLIAGPDDIAFDRSGCMFATLVYKGSVGALEPSGRYRIVLDDCPAANGITVTVDGRLFVDEMREGARLLEVSRTDRNKYRVVRDELSMLNALEQGPDGRLYSPQMMEGNVIAIEPDSGDMEVVAEGFEMPVAVKFDSNGSMVVADSGAGEIVAIDHSGRNILISTDRGIDNFDFDQNHVVYMSSYVDGRIERAVPRQCGSSELVIGPGLIGPFGVCDVSGEVLVADGTSLAIVSMDGSVERILPKWGDLRGLTGYPFIVGAASAPGLGAFVLMLSGDVYQVSLAERVFAHVLSAPRTEARPAWGQSSPLSGHRVGEGAVCAIGSGSGRVIVAMGGSGQIFEISTADGHLLHVVDTGIASVSAVAAGADFVAAADRNSGRVLVVGSGRHMEFNGFTAPRALGLFGGDLYVADAASRTITSLRLDTGVRRVIASDLAFGPSGPSGISILDRGPSLLVQTDGSLIVGCDGSGALLRLARVA